ncbi:MAG: hypothetical protein Q7I97_08035 [Thermovirgaceae bacterium]|nr:hypothetical protein [Thermovirgaceae bacterium]
MTHKARLKVFLEQPGFSVGCVNLEYGEEEMKSFPLAEVRVRVGRLLVNIRERYGASLRVDLIDPRNIVSLFGIFRYRVKSTEPVWILDGSLIFRGVPEWEALQNSIDRTMEGRGRQG